MKTAAAIFSWLGGIGNIVATAIVVVYYHYIFNKLGIYVPEIDISDTSYPIVLWFFWGIFSIIQISILGWRGYSVEKGHNVGCGIITLLFVSFLGGLLTLCIPRKQFMVANYYNNNNTNTYSSSGNLNQSQVDDKKEKENQSIELIKNYKKLLDDGIISQEEFDKKKKELLN